MSSFGKKSTNPIPGFTFGGRQPDVDDAPPRPRAIWHWWFAIAIGGYLIQLFPLTGLIVMMLGAPGWTVITVNGGFIAIIYDCVRRAAPVWLLAAPVLWFGGYWTFVAMEQVELAKLSHSIDAANKTVSVPFDPDRHSFVGANGITDRLVSDYGIPVVYEKSDGRQAAYKSVRIVPLAICRQVRENAALRASGINVLFHKSPGSTVLDECKLSRPENPAHRLYTVTPVKTEEGPMQAKLVHLELRNPEGRSGRVVSGNVSTLPWIPMPIAGCTLIDSPSSWSCFQGFMRSPVYFASAENVAAAMGLEKRKAGAPRPGGQQAEKEVSDALRRVAADKLADELIILDRFLALPAVKQDSLWRLDQLSMDATPARDRAPLMPRALQMALTHNSDGAKALMRVLAALPPDTLKSVGPQFVQALEAAERDKPSTWKYIAEHTERLVLKLTEAGVQTTDIAVKLLEARPMDRSPAETICRIGPSAADKAAPLLVAGLARARSDTHQAYYVALLRLGRRDQLLALPESASPDRRRLAWYDHVTKTVSPASPPSVCSF